VQQDEAVCQPILSSLTGTPPVVAVLSKSMLGWKIVAMVSVVLGALLASARISRVLKLRLSGPSEKVGEWLGGIPFAISGYFAFSYLPHKTEIGPWFASLGWLRWLLCVVSFYSLFLALFVFAMAESEWWKKTAKLKEAVSAVLFWLVITGAVVAGFGAGRAFLGSIFFWGGVFVALVAITLEQVLRRLVQSEDAVVGISILLVGVASFIQIFILNP